MRSDLSKLMHYGGTQASYNVYHDAVVIENLLSKPSQKSRRLAWRHLAGLYSLSSDHCLFRVFRDFYFFDQQAQPLLTFQLAYARDPVLRACMPFLSRLSLNQQISRADTEELLKTLYPQRFTPASLKSCAQNINGTWTQSGFLQGKVRKTRVQPVVSWVNAAYALFMASLQGHQARMMLTSQWVRILGLPEEEILQLASRAAQKGLMDYRRTGDVMEFRFPDSLTEQEHEWLNESY